MTAQTDPYVRVYYRILSDERFAAVYEDDAALATWLRLLMIADGAYPAPAHLPRNAKSKPLGRLTASGLVELIGRDMYRIHGLQKEREARSEAATFAADVKYHGLPEAKRLQEVRTAERMRAQSDRNAGAVQPESVSNADALPLRTSPSNSSPSRAEHYAALEEVTLLPMGRVEYKTRVELDRLADQRGTHEVAIALREVAERIPTQPPSARQVVFEAVKHLEPFSTGTTPKPKGMSNVDDLRRATEVV